MAAWLSPETQTPPFQACLTLKTDLKQLADPSHQTACTFSAAGPHPWLQQPPRYPLTVTPGRQLLYNILSLFLCTPSFVPRPCHVLVHPEGLTPVPALSTFIYSQLWPKLDLAACSCPNLTISAQTLHVLLWDTRTIWLTIATVGRRQAVYATVALNDSSKSPAQGYLACIPLHPC